MKTAGLKKQREARDADEASIEEGEAVMVEGGAAKGNGKYHRGATRQRTAFLGQPQR